MRESVRPMLRLALFGTYTILAIGIHEVRSRIWARRISSLVKDRARTGGRRQRR